jgi:hypothetical protein
MRTLSSQPHPPPPCPPRTWRVSERASPLPQGRWLTQRVPNLQHLRPVQPSRASGRWRAQPLRAQMKRLQVPAQLPRVLGKPLRMWAQPPRVRAQPPQGRAQPLQVRGKPLPAQPPRVRAELPRVRPQLPRVRAQLPRARMKRLQVPAQPVQVRAQLLRLPV